MIETTLVLEGVEPEAVTEEFLSAVLNAAEAEGLDVEGVSVERDRDSE